MPTATKKKTRRRATPGLAKKSTRVQLSLATATRLRKLKLKNFKKVGEKGGGFQITLLEVRDDLWEDNTADLPDAMIVRLEKHASEQKTGSYQDAARAMLKDYYRTPRGRKWLKTKDPFDERRLVTPGFEPKSGCMWCPLLPWSADWADLEDDFNRDGGKILAKEKDGHSVQSRCVSESLTDVDILFVGEAPGALEDRKGAPFVGGSGGLLRKTIDYVGIDLDRVGFSNMVSCRPPRNRKPNKTEVQSCAPKLIREIQTRDPDLVVVCGNTSLEYLTGQTGITTFTGKILDCIRPELEGLKVLACLHPAYVLRMDHLLDKFAEAISTAAQFLSGDYVAKQGLGVYETLTDLDEIEELFTRFRTEELPVSFDTETGSTNAFQEEFDKLLCFSFSNTAGEGFAIPFDHADSPFRRPGRKRRRLTKMLVDFFLDEEIEKTAQNEKFDRNHIRAAIGVEPTNVTDTMLLHFVIDERRGTHGLKSLAYAYTGMGGYEHALDVYIENHHEANPKRGGSYANIPGEVLFPYAAMDADVTVRVREGLMEESDFTSNPKLQRLALDFYPELSRTLADMEFEGAQIDPGMVSFLDKKYTRAMARVMKKIKKDPKVADFLAAREADNPKKYAGEPFNPESTQQLQQVLYVHYGEKPIELTDAGFSKLKARLQKRVQEFRAKNKKLLGQPTFSKVVADAVKNVEWEYFSTKADVLHDFERNGNPLCELILEHRSYSTLHGTFVKPLQTKLDSNLRIHGSFLPHGTVTARLASKEPNLQNIPNKGGGLVKRCYVSRFGEDGMFLQSDYSQIELRIAACFFNEPSMIRAYKRGDDLHTLTAAVIAKMPMSRFVKLPKSKQKEWRTRAKRVNFGVLYGGGPPALVNTLRKDGVFITVDEARKLIDAYFEGRPDLKKGMDALMAQVKDTGYLEAFTGHRRRVPEVFAQDESIVARALRQSINFPIQCAAAQMTNMAMVLINRDMKEAGFESRMVLTTHDSIAFDTHVDEMQDLAILARDVMEQIPQRSGDVLPGLDWSWLNVPIIADLEAGFDWGTLVEFNECRVGDEQRKIIVDKIDLDYLWAAMTEKAAA